MDVCSNVSSLLLCHMDNLRHLCLFLCLQIMRNTTKAEKKHSQNMFSSFNGQT